MIKIIIVRGLKSSTKCFTDDEHGNKIFEALKPHYEEIFKVSYTEAFSPPEGYQPNFPRKTWCPYCSAERRFKKNPIQDCYICSICGISERDFWIKKYNDIWKYEALGGNTRKVRKAFKSLKTQKDSSVENLGTSKSDRRKQRKKLRDSKANK